MGILQTLGDPVEDVQWFRKRTQIVLTSTVCLPVSSFWMSLYRVFMPERPIVTATISIGLAASA